MNRPAQVETLFFAALEANSQAERVALLDSACAGDAELRREVERLLGYHSQLGDFLDKPVMGPLCEALAELDTTQFRHAQIDTDRDGSDVGHDDVVGLLAPATAPGSLGRLGDYEVLEFLGRGGFGTVFRAFDASLEREVAIKVLAPVLAASHEARTRFLREARAAAKIRHENIVHVYAVDDQPLPHLVMELVPGETLQTRITRLGPLETAEVVRLGRQIAEGLAAAHRKGVIHRDIKPANILIESSSPERVKITDFGLAGAADEAQATSGMLAGTPMYMAPEQAQGGAVDERSDLFSLGSVLYAMCTGQAAYQADSTLSVLRRVTDEQPRPIRELNPRTPLWLCKIISRLHAKVPRERIATAQEVAEMLAAGVVGTAKPLSVSADPLSPTSRSPARRRWTLLSAVGAALLVALALTEYAGLAPFYGVVMRLFLPEGTLVVEIDDPDIQVKVDGSELLIAGAGVQEIRVRTGRHAVEASKNGQLLRRELVTITKNDRQVIRISQEAAAADVTGSSPEDSSVWERSVAAIPAAEQVKAVEERLRQLNPGFHDPLVPVIADGVVTELKISTEHLMDLSPVRALSGLRKLNCANSRTRGILADLSPLKGLKLTHLDVFNNPVSDLTPLAGMPLVRLHCPLTKVSDLTPLKGMPLRQFYGAYTSVTDLSPLRGMSLTSATFEGCQVSDLSPLAGMPLTNLSIGRQVTDLTPLVGMPLEELTCAYASQLTDLSPLAGMSLKSINLDGTAVTDLRPLAGMPLGNLGINGTQVTDLTPLRDMTTLRRIALGEVSRFADLKPLEGLGVETLHVGYFQADRDAKKLRPLSTLKWINGQPAAEFWKAVEP